MVDEANAIPIKDMTRKEIRTVADLIEVVHAWEQKSHPVGKGYPPVWYRGHADASWDLQPTVLRKWFLDYAAQADFRFPQAANLVNIENTINNQFRRMATSLLPSTATIVDIYFLAQHHGIPTRLLDWTADALAALFFAVCCEPEKDGMIHTINPRFLIPDINNPQYPRDVVNIRHSLVSGTIQFLFDEGASPRTTFILPIYPDLRAGRMLQQVACFTLHMPPLPFSGREGPTEPIHKLTGVESYLVSRTAKKQLLLDLRRVGKNYATLFPDLDNVAREIRTAWELYPPQDSR